MGEQGDESEGWRAIVRLALVAVRRCAGRVAQGSPPEPCSEVQDLLKSLKIKPNHLLQLYNTFHAIHQSEREDEIITLATEVEAESLLQLVKERRQWVMGLLKRLLLMGGCEESVTWDQFLWIFLRFCSLNRVELCQALFVMISREVESPTLHYLTSEELHGFYWAYRNCPVRSFNTESMDFDKLPLTRYYASDFCELVIRFPRLLNPASHLQTSLQAVMPSSDFWHNFDQSSFCRKISHEFFLMEQHRVFIRGEPPFRETCDMLAPDALGPAPVNPDQWVLRTSAARCGKGLRQRSVWGEQPPPEILELLPHSSHGKEALAKAMVDLGLAPDAPGQPARPAAPPQPVEAWGSRPDQPPPPTERPPRARGAGAPVPDPSQLSLAAAISDEDDARPADVLPLAWMRSFAVAPAPVVRGPDPPLRRPVAERRRFVTSDTKLG